MSVTDESHDPVLYAWLTFLDEEMAAHPERIKPLSADLIARAQALVDDIEVDPDEDLGVDLILDDSVEHP